MEISVEHDKRTGKSQVVSTATITPENIQKRGLKLYDDGRKSIYALDPDGGTLYPGVDGEMSPKQVEELLRQATDENVPHDLLYHQPVYSAAYFGTSRPKTSNKAQNQMLTTCQSPSQPAIESTQLTQEQTEPNSHAQSLNGEEMRESNEHIQGTSKPLIPQICSLQFSAQSVQGLDNKNHMNSYSKTPLVTIKVRPEEKSTPLRLVRRGIDGGRSSETGQKYQVDSLIESSDKTKTDIKAENFASTNVFNKQPGQLELTAVTMIFMGYENALDEEDVDFQAELVTVGCSDDDDDDDDDDDEVNYIVNKNNGEFLSFHPEGYKSKVFQPELAKGFVTGCKYISEDAVATWKHLGLHRPTFIHKSGNKEPL
ncbi:palmdelphin-like [Phyllopteryx taeniolatus]|uniref:palmdelphin-like n=1 Tax=Phyllopteryx taeniolatus TaxID=161469 RepID=UPI002AD494B6|nr:palmdelphin-like [Phyllopteryx taeniolatus]